MDTTWLLVAVVSRLGLLGSPAACVVDGSFPSASGGPAFGDGTQTGKQESLGTRDRNEAKRLFHAKAEAQQQPRLNLQIARAYLMAGDPEISSRTWQHVMNEIVKTKTVSTHLRWTRAIKDKAFDLIRDVPMLETQAQHFLKVMETGTAAANVYLRRVCNFAMDIQKH